MKFNRRNIIVFSAANLSALTIGHGHEESSGCDLLLSYHDNDHYSSVVDNNRQIQPSSRAMIEKLVEDAKKSKNGMAGDNVNKSKNKNTSENNNADNGNADNSDKSDNKPNTKKNDPCPCGSGRKYKKCCLAREKHAKRVQRMKGANTDSHGEGSDDETTDKGVQVFEMNGDFRVLQI